MHRPNSPRLRPKAGAARRTEIVQILNELTALFAAFRHGLAEEAAYQCYDVNALTTILEQQIRQLIEKASRAGAKQGMRATFGDLRLWDER